MRITLIVLVGVLVATPSSVATWRVAGSFEPDTPYDSAEWMFQEPPPAGSSRLYFQVVTMPYVYDAGLSPNVGLLETRNEAPASEYHYGIFGVWKDCNQDGYIGAAEQALREYSARILFDTSVCPPVTGPITTWTAGAHNYNGWVSELVPLSNNPNSADKRHYRDDATMVWGDHGRPDTPSFRRACSTDGIVPYGTLQSSGALLNFVACHTDQRGISFTEASNDAMETIGDPASLRFEDTSDARSGALGQMETFGDEESEESPVYVWDCSSGTASPSPSINDLDSRSVAALFNHTYEGAPVVEDCDPSSDYGEEFYGLVEDDERGVDPNNRTRPDWYFDYRSGSRGGNPFGPALGPGVSGAPGNDAGIGWTGLSFSTSGWYPAWNQYAKLGPDLVRVDLDAGSADLAAAYWLTFYAYVGPTTLDRPFARPENVGGTYGGWACAGHDSGIHSGWNCDPKVWYTRDNGGPLPLPSYPIPRVGQLYQFRDVDCYDGGNSLDVPLGPAGYGTEPCP